MNRLVTYANVPNIELEVRFGRSTRNGFQPGITEKQFKTIETGIAKTFTRTKVDVLTDVTYPDHIRVSNGTPIQKLRKWKLDEPYLRWCASTETPCDHPNTDPIQTREKHRTTYLREGVQLDFTRVTTTKNGEFVSDTHEVELELKDTNNTELAQKVINLIVKTIK